MSQAIRLRVGKEFVGESKCCVSVIVIDCVSVCLHWWLYVYLCVLLQLQGSLQEHLAAYLRTRTVG